MKLELVVNGQNRASCSSEADFLSFQASVFLALSEMQKELNNQSRTLAASKMAQLNEKVFKRVPKDRTVEDQEAE